jgi:hypothetical protein
MGKHDKILEKILSRSADKNISFRDLCNLLKSLGFQERIRGDHYIFSTEWIDEILNLQPKGSKAKPYQVKQVRKMILKYNLGEQDND